MGLFAVLCACGDKGDVCIGYAVITLELLEFIPCCSGKFVVLVRLTNCAATSSASP